MLRPGSRVSVCAELTTKDRLSYIILLNLKNHRATLRFAPELKNEPRVRFGPDNDVKSRVRFVNLVRFAVLFFEPEPAAVERDGARERGGEVDGEVDPADEFRGGDAACAGGAAGVDGEAESERSNGEAAERGGVEVEA